ncbi:MAG TPA: twin-arginine translocase subunit TatB [Methylocystis sp.]|nr:twin-arginine translocase subunit TatB [Methylocystis sp.]
MLDFDAGKLIVIGIVALVAIPSKDLPRVLRQLGQWTAQARRMAAEFQSQLMEAIREADLEDAKRDVQSAFDGATQAASFDPLAAAKQEINAALEGPPAPSPKKPESEGESEKAGPSA